MNQAAKKAQPPRPEHTHAIRKWARAYGQNRSLGVVVSMIIFLALSAAIGGPSYLAGEAHRSGNMPLFWGCLAVIAVASAALTYFSVPHWGGKLQERIVQRLYASEGKVALSPPAQRKRVWGQVLAVCFGTCILSSVVLGFVVDIPSKYMQPISALYVVPFLVSLWILMRPAVGYLPLLWPVLYAIHAVLIVAGAPIVFTGPWGTLNILIPVAGYGVLSGIAGHVYSRFALSRLTRLTRADEGASGTPEDVVES